MPDTMSIVNYPEWFWELWNASHSLSVEQKYLPRPHLSGMCFMFLNKASGEVTYHSSGNQVWPELVNDVGRYSVDDEAYTIYLGNLE